MLETIGGLSVKIEDEKKEGKDKKEETEKVMLEEGYGQWK